MSEKSLTIIISDLHLGGGTAAGNDDHVSDKSQLQNFILELASDPRGRAGDIELFINGDFLDFAQVAPEIYTLHSNRYWCSEDESCGKLRRIVLGHAEIFKALQDLQALGNRVTVAAGNHDVDLYWNATRQALRQVAGPVEFVIGQEWILRHEGRLAIAHGHMFCSANKFANWKNPILEIPGSVSRLEMCAGTFFMVKFVNWLDAKYPFANNIKPVTALAPILMRGDRFGLLAAGWMFNRFLTEYPTEALTSGGSKTDFKKSFSNHLKDDADFRRDVARLYSRAYSNEVAPEHIVSSLAGEETLFQFLYATLAYLSPDEWLAFFDIDGVLGIGDKTGTLGILEANRVDESETFRRKAEEVLGSGVEIAVLGHTHQPDEIRHADGGYFNPGSWTRFLDLNKKGRMKLEDLKDESRFPYQLNYIRIERSNGGALRADKICYDETEW